MITLLQKILAVLLDRLEPRRLVAFKSGYEAVTVDPQRLPDIPCDMVWLSVWNTEQDPSYSFQPEDANASYNKANLEVYWGIGVPGHQLFPTNTTRDIWINNLRNIFANCSSKKAGGNPDFTQFIGYTCFKYMTEEEIKRRGI